MTRLTGTSTENGMSTELENDGVLINIVTWDNVAIDIGTTEDTHKKKVHWKKWAHLILCFACRNTPSKRVSQCLRKRSVTTSRTLWQLRMLRSLVIAISKSAAPLKKTRGSWRDFTLVSWLKKILKSGDNDRPFHQKPTTNLSLLGNYQKFVFPNNHWNRKCNDQQHLRMFWTLAELSFFVFHDDTPKEMNKCQTQMSLRILTKVGQISSWY